MKPLFVSMCATAALAAFPLHAQDSGPVAAAAKAPSVTMTMALVGDSLITQRLSPYREPEFLGLIDLLRSADVAFTNLEMLFHNYEGYPSAVSGGTYMRADPKIARELAWAGFDLVSTANNHTGDYGVESLFSTARALDEAGIVYAGTGENLQQAREAHYADTAKGRVALVACASTFSPHSVAGRQRSDVKGRPGLNPLRFDTTYMVDQATLDQLRDLAAKLKLEDESVEQGRAAEGGVTFLGARFVLGDKFGMFRTPWKQDMDAIAAAVKDGKAMSRHVIVSLHSHEKNEKNPKDRSSPSDLFVAFAHAMIDAGASVVVGQGEHSLHGIEVYKGKPIFYCLGDFIIQNDTVLRQPQENYDIQGLGLEARVSEFNARRATNAHRRRSTQQAIWETVVAQPKFVDDRLIEIRLVPLTLGFGQPSGMRGRPVLAKPDDANRILANLARMSAPLGTRIENRNGVGYVQLPP